MSDGNGTALAERKEKITAAEALQLVQKFAKERFREDSSASSRAIAEADQFAGGQTERLDAEVLNQGRAWATRLALIARRTAGSGYQVSKTSAAITPVVKKLYSLIGELEAVMATDVEISLFSTPKREEYLGYGNASSPEKFVKDFTDNAEPGDEIGREDIVDAIKGEVGDRIEEHVDELLAGYEIEPIVVPSETEDEEAGSKRRRRRSRG